MRALDRAAGWVSVDEVILQWALRYALGRQTFAPTDVQQAVRANLDRLTPRFLTVAIQDIDNAERDAQTDWGHYALGHPTIDAPTWRQLRDDLRHHLEATS